MIVKKIEIQGENVRNLMRLIQSNPDLEILPMVRYECVPGDEWGWWMASLGKVSIEEYWQDYERCFIRSQDEEELIDKFYDEADDSLSDSEAIDAAELKVDGLPWVKAICVYIVP